MKILLFLFPICSIFHFSYANNLEDYYHLIQKAENKIIENELDSSSYYYAEAFQKREYPFAKHLFNAAVVNAKIKKFKLVYPALKKLMELGAGFESLHSNSAFAGFFRSSEGKRFQNAQQSFKPVYNYEYREKLKQLFERDQCFRVLPNAYTQYADTIRKTDQQNIYDFLNLIKKYGFPSEMIVGIAEEGFQTGVYYPLLIIHQENGPHQQFNFAEILKENILNGNLENEFGNDLINLSNGTQPFNIMKVMYVKVLDEKRNPSRPDNYLALDSTGWGYFPLTDAEWEKINASRRPLLLEDFATFLRKTLFGLTHQEYLLNSLVSNMKLIITNRENFEELKKKIITK